MEMLPLIQRFTVLCHARTRTRTTCPTSSHITKLIISSSPDNKARLLMMARE